MSRPKFLHVAALVGVVVVATLSIAEALLRGDETPVRADELYFQIGVTIWVLLVVLLIPSGRRVKP